MIETLAHEGEIRKTLLSGVSHPRRPHLSPPICKSTSQMTWQGGKAKKMIITWHRPIWGEGVYLAETDSGHGGSVSVAADRAEQTVTTSPGGFSMQRHGIIVAQACQEDTSNGAFRGNECHVAHASANLQLRVTSCSPASTMEQQCIQFRPPDLRISGSISSGLAHTRRAELRRPDC